VLINRNEQELTSLFGKAYWGRTSLEGWEKEIKNFIPGTKEMEKYRLVYLEKSRKMVIMSLILHQKFLRKTITLCHR
jgi:hypothetical protein